MKIINKIILVAIITLSFNVKVIANDYTYGVTHFPPFSIVEKNNKYGGLILDMIKTLDHAGIDYSVSALPLKRLYRGLFTGDVSIFIGVRSSLFDNHVIYSRDPIAEIDLRIYSTGKTPLPKAIPELKGKKIIVIRGYSYGPLGEFLNDPKSRISLEYTSEHLTALKMLRAQRADYLIDYKLPVKMSCGSIFPKGKGLKSHSLKKMKMYFLVSKKARNHKSLMKKISKSFVYLKKNRKLNYISALNGN